MEINIYLESELPELTARDVSRWLVCIATIRDALAMMQSNDVTWLEYFSFFPIAPLRQESDYFTESRAQIHGPFPLNYYLRQLGLDLLSQGQIPFSPDAHFFARRALSQVDQRYQEVMDRFRPAPQIQSGRGPEILSVTKGSISTRIKEGIDWVAGHLRDLLGTANGFVHVTNRAQFYESVAKIASSLPSDRSRREIAAGLLVASGLTLEEILATLQAKQIGVEHTDSDVRG
jgi:hypothetical protein